MKAILSRITAQGQISVPAEIRRRLALGPGSVLQWDAGEDGVKIRRMGRHRLDDLHAAFFDRQPELKSLGELKEGIRRKMKERHAGG